MRSHHDIFRYIASGSDPSVVLLLLYWALNLPALGQTLVDLALQYPVQRNRVLRLLEPLNAGEEEKEIERLGDWETRETKIPQSPNLPISITLENVTIHAGGHSILREINLRIAPGEHVAIVGASGAGKSSLVGLLLGWQRVAAGQVRVNGEVLNGESLRRLRQQTAWVDPTVQLWNRTLLENLQYGATDVGTGRAQQAMLDADLFRLLESLPGGLQTKLGEGGGLVSGGEGQRVRLGRALLRPAVRLAILDEPFRGLDRGKRRQLLRSARQHWQQATLLCITHDVSETLEFPRLLFIHEGQIIEDGDPRQLAADATSRYRRMLDAEAAVQLGLWEGAEWRRLWMEDGRLEERR